MVSSLLSAGVSGKLPDDESDTAGMASFLEATGLCPITSIDAKDVFIVGYPKSGNTWFQNLAAGVVHGVIPEFAPPTLTYHELIPDVHLKRFYKRYSTPMFFKSHHLPKPEYRRVIYLLRDGRDAMVSYYHYLAALQRQIDFLQMIKTGEGLFPGKWHDHVEAWLANPYQADIMILRYEDLKTNTVEQLERFCAFLGIQRERSFLEMMARSASFENLRKKEVTVGMGAENKRWIKGKFFFRRGAVGSFADEMPETVLQAFLDDAAATLKKLNYLK